MFISLHCYLCSHLLGSQVEVCSLYFVRMSALEAAFNQEKEALKAEGLAKQKVRLVADPFIGVSDIENALSRHCQTQKCSDIHALLCATASLVHITWQTPPHAEWMLKLSPLIYEVLEFAPQTKLQSSKVKKALQALLNKKLCTISGKEEKDVILDRCDLCLRMVLNMYRDVKSKPILKQRVMRNLSREDGIKLGLVLDRVQLPAEHVDSQENVVNGSCGATELLALEDGDPSMDLLEKAVQEVALQEVNPKTARPLLKRSLQFGPAALPDADPIFQKILKQAEDEGCVKPDMGVAKEKKLSSQELLLKAINFVPEQVGKGSKKGDKQQPFEAKSKPGKGSKPVPKTSMKALKSMKVMKSMKVKKVPAAKMEKKDKKAISKPIPKKKDKKEKEEKLVKKVADSSTPPLDYQDYKVEDYPRQSDIYRNTYTSRHYHKARTMAERAGFSYQEACATGKKAIQEASKLWDDTHLN